MTLAVDMRGGRSVAGWLASEKLNGCRAYWDGRQFWTRGGHPVGAGHSLKQALRYLPVGNQVIFFRQEFIDVHFLSGVFRDFCCFNEVLKIFK